MSVNKTIIVWICLLLIKYKANSQNKEGNKWVAGNTMQYINFNKQPAQIDTMLPPIYKYFANGHSNICDSNGNMILVSDGYNLYDSTGAYIEDGDTLVSHDMYAYFNGWSIFAQSSIFLPMGNGIYYLITPNATDSKFSTWETIPYVSTSWFDELLLHKIDMNANGGMGKIVEKGKKIMQQEKILLTMMMACRHANGKDWWLLKQMYEDSGNYNGPYPLCKNKIAKILITKDSIYPPTIQYFNSPDIGFFYQSGQAMFSQDGSKYAVTCRSMNQVFLADFDRCTGELSNGKTIHVPNYSRHDPSDTTLQDVYTQGLCFSPNGRFLYVIKFFNILQLDLWDTDSSTAWHHVAGLDTTWNVFMLYNSSNVGPDGKLYIGNWHVVSQQMSVINNPNAKGSACNFCPRCLISNAQYSLSTPPTMPNYDLGADTTKPCWPLQSDELGVMNDELVVYPNPAKDEMKIKHSYTNFNELKVELFDNTGRKLKTVICNSCNYEIKITLNEYSVGLYTYSISIDNMVAAQGKISIIK